jgi:hypothetical protein
MSSIKNYTTSVMMYALCCVTVLFTTELSAESRYVQVRKTALRSQPSMISPSVSTLKYGDTVELLESAQDSWLRVKASGRSGYLHVSATTSRKVVLQQRDIRSADSVSSSDVVLAGKGFSREVERAFAAKNGVSLAAVDSIERNSVSSVEIAQFIASGKLGSNLDQRK